MSNPEVNFTDPNGLLINCGMLNDAGKLGGIITPNDCALISPFASIPCGCSTGNTDEDTTDAPTDTVTDGTTTIAPVAVAEDDATTTTTDAPVVDVTTTDAPVAAIVPGAPVPVPALTTPPFLDSGAAVGVEGTESTSSSSSSSTNSLALLIGTALVVLTTLFM